MRLPKFGLARTLQRQGKVDEAHVAMERFQQGDEREAFLPVLSYLWGRGSLGRAEDAATDAPKVGPMIPVIFSRAWESSSDETQKSDSGLPDAACLIDVDGRWSSQLACDGERSIRRANVPEYRRQAASSWYRQLKLDWRSVVDGIACAVGDFDNDGLPDIAIATSDRVLLFRNIGGGRFADVTQPARIVTINHPSGLIFVDYDHDGDLDLFVTGEGNNGSRPNVLWRNNGDKTFTDWTQQAGLGGEGSTTAAMLTDLNNDRAVDLVVTGSGSTPTFFANPRDGAFRPTPLFPESGLPPTTGVIALDFNKDGWMDIALTHSGTPGLSLWKNVDGKRFERVALPLQNATRGWSVAAIDFDNDGWLDLADDRRDRKRIGIEDVAQHWSRMGLST